MFAIPSMVLVGVFGNVNFGVGPVAAPICSTEVLFSPPADDEGFAETGTPTTRGREEFNGTEIAFEIEVVDVIIGEKMMGLIVPISAVMATEGATDDEAWVSPMTRFCQITAPLTYTGSTYYWL